ncbi:uncharacterized protein LOC131805764 [Musca domestica]|uniref:DUF725 domain-containing protein n=1 Tax=Musca domestica TaxID=7370 RepID=A0A1I8NDI2_MUSDO|nr:uncharacterized protein LOC131805764 [Musca domestica]
MSFSKIVYVFLSVCLVFTWAGSQPLGKLPTDLEFLSFMSNSRVNLQANPDQSIECFNYYIPKINNIAQNYSADLSKCADTSGTAQKSAEDATLEQRITLAHAVNASCEVLNKCQESATVSDIFQCYINEGSQQAKALYGVSTNATMQLSDLVETLRRIQSEEAACSTQAKVKYERDSAAAYADLNSCILGNSNIPTTTTTTTTSTEVFSTSEITNVPTTSESTTIPTTINPDEDPDKLQRK